MAEAGGEKKRVAAMIEALGLTLDEEQRANLQIECFDISHTAGEATQGLLRRFPGTCDGRQPLPAL